MKHYLAALFVAMSAPAWAENPFPSLPGSNADTWVRWKPLDEPNVLGEIIINNGAYTSDENLKRVARREPSQTTWLEFTLPTEAGDIVVCMGAGSITYMAAKLPDELRKLAGKAA